MKVKKPSSSPLDQALHFLSFRLRSEAEIASYLKRKKIPLVEISTVVNKLKDLQFIDDVKFCSWWQESRDQTHPVSCRVLTQELRQKGVTHEIIAQTLDISHETESKRAVNALASKRHIGDPASFLARRGFSWEVISLTIKAAEGTI